MGAIATMQLGGLVTKRPKRVRSGAPVMQQQRSTKGTAAIVPAQELSGEQIVSALGKQLEVLTTERASGYNLQGRARV
jgi:hypothetical protein